MRTVLRPGLTTRLAPAVILSLPFLMMERQIGIKVRLTTLLLVALPMILPRLRGLEVNGCNWLVWILTPISSRIQQTQLAILQKTCNGNVQAFIPSRETKLATAYRSQVFFLLGRKCKRCPATSDLQVHLLFDDFGAHHNFGSVKRQRFYLKCAEAGDCVLLCRACHVIAERQKRIQARAERIGQSQLLGRLQLANPTVRQT